MPTTMQLQNQTATTEPYRLEEQVGFKLRRATQRHLAIFAAAIPDLTPTQFAALAKVHEREAISQNELGRCTAMDAATIKGVIDRLQDRGLILTSVNPSDRRRRLISLTDGGRQTLARFLPAAARVTRETVAPLTQEERDTLLRLLDRLS